MENLPKQYLKTFLIVNLKKDGTTFLIASLEEFLKETLEKIFPWRSLETNPPSWAAFSFFFLLTYLNKHKAGALPIFNRALSRVYQGKQVRKKSANASKWI